MTIIPKGGFVLLERELDAETTKGGIFLPETTRNDHAKKRFEVGRVLAVGPGYHDGSRFVPMQVSVGDRVLAEYGGAHPVPGDDTLALLSSAYIAAVFD